MAWEGRGVLKCSIKNDECRMNNMCCNFCVKDRAGCDGCDYEFYFCGCAIREDSDDLEELERIVNDNGKG